MTHAERTAIFIDAGWLLAAASLEVLGTPYRDELACDYKALIHGLESMVSDHSAGAPRLRTYWYDGAPDSAPTPDHHRIAGLDYVKVRLGRLNRKREQKGVDVLIYHDLLTLARERAITRAYLIAGDEDLREAVAETQKLGVQVVLVGMPIEEGHNQSVRLVREADEYFVLPRDVWEPACSRKDPDTDPTPHEDVQTARDTGRAFADRWRQEHSDGELRSLLDDFPKVPAQLDIELLLTAEEGLGSLRNRPDLKNELRGTFWLALKQHGSD